MRSVRNESGQTLIFTAFLMCVLFGFMAMAIDIGVLFRAQRKVQTAADAAAIAGALEYYYHGYTNAPTVARTAAGNNGITDTTNQVTVNHPPANGWHTSSGYLEVIIKQPNPTVFMAAFGGLLPGGPSNFTSMNVSARAVAGIVPGQSCVYVTDPTASGALSLKGGATVSSPNCSITVDSSSSSALCITGQNANAGFDTPGVFVSSAQQTNRNCNKLYSGAQTTGSGGSDPFATKISFPDPATACTNGNTVPAGITVISDTQTGTNVLSSSQVANYTGTATGGLSTESNHSYNITCFAGQNVTLNNANLGPSDANHVYLFENGMVISGTNTVNGTIDLNSGMYCQGSYNASSGNCSWNSAGGTPSITMNAPADTTDPTTGITTSYAWNGWAFIMPNTSTATNTIPTCSSSYGGPAYNGGFGTTPDACLQMQFGSQNGTINGMIYAPGAALYLQDSGGSVGVAGMVVDSLYVNSDLTITNYSYAHADSPLNHVALVE